MISRLRFRPTIPGKRLGALVALVLLSTLAVAAARNQGGHLRTVHGTVFSSRNSALANAVVYLKNLRTLSVRTYITNKSGHYHFSGLDPNVDYELHAEHGNLTSGAHTVSSFDSRNDIIITLRVNRKKSGS